jgi:cephalosporin hydroxylase
VGGSVNIDQAFASVKRTMEQWPNEIRPFTQFLAEKKPENILEIGVRNGGTASLWCHVASGLVVGVDWDQRDSLGHSNTIQLSNAMLSDYPNYRFVFGDSHSESTRKLIESLVPEVDFLFIDGDHSYEGVKKDFEMYSPLVKSGGLIAFHDIVDTDLIRSAGHGVHIFWRQLKGKKTEFCINGAWGGIGVLETE